MSTSWESSPPLGARYNVLQEIGEGGFGRTYLAEDLHRFKERCVLKEFVPQIDDPSLLAKAEELFEREAKVLYQLEHPQIPKFRELMREGGKLFLVQDYVEGTTYRSLLQGRQDYGGQFSETEITQLLYQLLPVLDYIHGLDIIHRDISPENLILRTADGKPVLIDFGSVKQIAATVEQELSANVNQTRIGKAGYVPQEQFHSGAVDPSSDLYGLAATLVVLATGKEPQELQDVYDNAWNWDQFVSLGEPLNGVLKKMLAPSPAQRYGSAAQVLQALQGTEQPVAAAADADDYGVAFVGAAEAEENGVVEESAMYTAGATQVVAPPPETAAVAPAAVGPVRQTNSRSGLEALLGLLALLGIVGLLAGLFGGLGWRPRWPAFGGGRSAPSDVRQPQRGLTADEVARKEEILQRRQNLGVNEAWLNQWVNQQFYDQYPNLRGRPLTAAVEDAPLRLRWDNLAMDSLDTLQLHLSMPARRGLGAYGADDRDSWRKLVNNLNVSSRALEDLSDAKFVSVFPKTPRDRVLDQPLGQMWYAMTQDSVEDLQSGKALERIEFGEGTFRDQRNGQLAVGQGQVFVLQLNEGQNLRINLQAPEDAVQMSLYLPTPSQKTPFLLSDSSKTTWSGRLEQSGFYEIAIASKSANPINYALSVAVDNISNTPDPSKPSDGETPKPEDKQPEDKQPEDQQPEDKQPEEKPESETPTSENETPTPGNDAQSPEAGDSTSESTDSAGNPVSF